MTEFFRRIYYLLNRRRLERELQHDMEVHREMLGQDSRKDFGNPSLLRERSREAWGWSRLDRGMQDLRFGMRLLRKSPALALTAITVLALGIGVNVTAFNIVDVMFFKPLPVRDPHSLVRFTAQSSTMSSTGVPYPAAMFYRDNNNVLSAVLAQASTTMTLTDNVNETVQAGLVSGNYFSELGLAPAYGRLFDPKTDESPNAPPVAVLGYHYWQNHFGGDATIVGRTIRLNQRPATVVGVTAFDFSGLDPEHGEKDEVWLIIDKLSYFIPDSKLLTSFDLNESGVFMTGRFKPGITRQAAAAALQPLSQELVRQHPDTLPRGLELVATAGGHAVNLDPGDAGMFPLFGLVGALVLLILAVACGNLGNLLLGHAVNREQEISIRLALGATRKRIVRQLMTESLLLALLGAAAGLLLSWYASRTLVLALGGLGNLSLTPDWRTLLFAIGVGTLACVLFGLPPARQASRQAHHKSRARTIFMATQVAASCVLLVVGALLVRALHNALTADPGFDYKQVVTIDPQLYEHAYTPEKAKEYMDQLRSRLQQVPGVESTAYTTHPPLGTRVTIHRTPYGPVYISRTTPGYFHAMAIPLLRGRDFFENEQDAAIVSDSCARRMWPGKDPLQQVYTDGGKKMRVVGVSRNARTIALRDGTSAEMYIPMQDKNISESVILVRGSRPPEQFISLLGGVARSIDPALSPKVAALHDAYKDKLGDTGKLAAVVSGMGLLALLLAVVGLYGVVSYHVAQNTREIGIRIALGAQPGRVVRSMVTRFFLPLALALCLGMVLAAGLSLILRSELYGISNFDPLSYLSAVVVLAGVGGMAALVPARRALKVDPMVALRSE